MRRRLALAAVALCAGTALVVTVPAPSPAASVDIPAVQEAHFAVIDRIASWDALTPVSRMGRVEGDPVAGSIEIGWVGQVPSDVQQMAADAAAEGITITFVEQAASDEELVALAYDLAASMPVEGAFSVGIGTDSLSVEVPTQEAAEAAGTEPIPLEEGEVAEVLDATEQSAADLGVSVTVEETDTVPTTTALGPLELGTPLDSAAATAIRTGRSNDTGVLSGGMRVRTQFLSGSYVSCTSGFTGTYGHQSLIVTAAHCSDYADGRAVQNAAGIRIGRSGLVGTLNTGTTAYDLGIIAAGYDTRTLPRIYTNETATVQITGTQVSFPPAGYRLCSSGQITGWKCDLTSGEAYVTCYATGRGTKCMHVQIVRSSGTSAFCLGDSGGPVVTAPTSAGAVAVGVVSGVKSTVSVRCSQEGLIAPISQLMSTVHGLQLHTTP